MKNVHSGVRPLVIQLLATSFMTGLIWFVQVVHYPLMEGWPHDDFGSWEAAHREHTGPVVIPPMLIEGVVAVWLLMHRPRGVNPFLPVLGIIALLGIWGSTFFLQVPCHLHSGAIHISLVQLRSLKLLILPTLSAKRSIKLAVGSTP